jgi:hypothetical protein
MDGLFDVNAGLQIVASLAVVFYWHGVAFGNRRVGSE